MTSLESILDLRPAELGDLLRKGYSIDPGALADANYFGVSLGLPAIVERFTWKVFRKAFRRDPASGRVVGFNVRLQQLGIGGPAEPMLKRGKPIEFGPFAVTELPPDGSPFGCRAGVLLDYGVPASALSPLGLVRDPLVALEPGSVELLLGATYLASPLSRRSSIAKTPSFFVLRREPA
ncbi:MAG: hypothetical protein U0271_46315 [Polyangiaceae bacterium]